jgi:hypothetical protein
MQYVFTMLQSQHSNVFERFAGLITDQVKRGVGDKSTEVRAVSRKCYWALQNRWIQRGNDLMASFDAKTQKLIMQLEHTWAGEEEAPTRRAAPIKAKKSRKSIGGGKSSAGLGAGAVRALRVEPVEAESSPPRSPVVVSKRKSLGGPSRTPVAARRSLGMVEQRRGEASAEPVSSLKSGAVRVSRPVPIVVEVAVVDDKENEAAKSQSKTPKTPRTPRAKTPRSIRDKSEGQESQESISEPVSTHTHLQPVIAQGSSKLWSARLQCFQELLGVFESAPTPASQSEVLLNLDRLVNLFDAKLTDPHHQVALSALAAMRSLLACRHLDIGDIKSYHLERLMPSVFHQLTNSKLPIRSSANQLLNELATKFSQEWLLSVLTIVLDRQVMFVL